MYYFKKSIYPIFLLFFIFVLSATSSLHAAPGIINYQGTLTDNAGQPVTATKSMTFSIYAAISDTSAKWTSTISGITVKNGSFSVNLGEQNTFPAGLFDSDSLFLGIVVDGVELAPRKRLVSVPYALSAGTAETGGIPKGGIIMWSGAVNQIPTGWALCDGQNGTPNLKDRFIVGAGNTYSVASTGGEVAHTLTIGEMPSHTHIQNAHTHAQDPHSHNISSGWSDNGTNDSLTMSDEGNNGKRTNSTQSSTGVNQNTTATNQNTGGGAAHNNLPPYYALAFIMKL